MRKSVKDWKLFKNVWMSKEPVLSGGWERKEGGHVVRARAKEPTTGKLREIFKVLRQATKAEALAWLEHAQARTRTGMVSAKNPQTRFSEFAAFLVEHKVKVGDIKSAKGRERWRHTLEHLIGGTESKTLSKRVDGFGDFFVDRIRAEHVEAWKASIAELIATREYSPTTVNGWLSILRVIMKAAKRKFGLLYLATEGVENFDVSEHQTFTEEEPNALLPDEVAPFMAKFKELYSEHFAMVYLGLLTGLRPSSLRPLRRRGDEADVLWEKNRILVRRSNTIGEEVMRTTKQRRRYGIDLPEEAMAVLVWHTQTQLKTPEQQDSDLLFPAVTGKFRAPSVLNKPLAVVAEESGLGKKFTQKGLRRTFNDLARAAQVNDLVTRSISGHLTTAMQHHYSTVNGEEQREALARVIRLVDHRGEPSSGEHGGEHDAGGGEQKKKAV